MNNITYHEDYKTFRENSTEYLKEQFRQIFLYNREPVYPLPITEWHRKYEDAKKSEHVAGDKSTDKVLSRKRQKKLYHLLHDKWEKYQKILTAREDDMPFSLLVKTVSDITGGIYAEHYLERKMVLECALELNPNLCPGQRTYPRHTIEMAVGEYAVYLDGYNGVKRRYTSERNPLFSLKSIVVYAFRGRNALQASIRELDEIYAVISRYHSAEDAYATIEHLLTVSRPAANNVRDYDVWALHHMMSKYMKSMEDVKKNDDWHKTLRYRLYMRFFYWEFSALLKEYNERALPEFNRKVTQIHNDYLSAL